MLSIVVLVYKTAHLLRRCLDSIVGQEGYSPEEIEIVVVSDHSPDNVDEVIAEYQREHPEIVYTVRAQNGGEAPARNTGLKLCTKKYYTYVDSDDCVTADYLTTILGILREHNPDMLTYRYETCDKDGQTISTIKARQEGLVDATTDKQSRRLAFNVFATNLRCNAVIRRGLTEGLSYHEEYKLGVDALFAFESYLRSKTFYISNAVLYKYYQYSESATHNFDSKRLTDLMLVHGRYLQELAKLAYYKDIAYDLFYFYASNYLTWLIAEAIRHGRESEVYRAYVATFGAFIERLQNDGAVNHVHGWWLKRYLKKPTLTKAKILLPVERVIRILFR